MLAKFKPGWEFVKPLTAHCGVHAAMTALISSIFLLCRSGPGYGLLPFGLAAFDFVVHFVMDRIKASPKLLGRYKALSASEMMGVLSLVDMGSQPKPHPELKIAAEGAFRQLRSNRFFWWSLGLDQMVHHLTHYAIIYWLVTA